MKKVGGGGGGEGKGTNVVKNSGYFPPCKAVEMLKIEARPGCTRTKGCSLAQETNKNTKVASKLEQGLNFTVKVDFWFCNDDFCKNPEGKIRNFCRFTMTLKTVILVHVQGGILQKALTLHFKDVPM